VSQTKRASKTVLLRTLPEKLPDDLLFDACTTAWISRQARSEIARDSSTLSCSLLVKTVVFRTNSSEMVLLNQEMKYLPTLLIARNSKSLQINMQQAIETVDALNITLTASYSFRAAHDYVMKAVPDFRLHSASNMTQRNPINPPSSQHQPVPVYIVWMD